MFKITQKSIEWGGKTLTLETGKIARQATGAVLVTYGETVVLCTATAAKKMKEGMDFFPLAVQYQEKTFAVGKIPGGFFKREARPSEKETLASRLIDRPIRPLFPAEFKNEVSVLCSVYSFDGKSDSEVAALIGASAALSISGLPFQGPIAAARVGYDNGEYTLNLDCDAEKNDLDLMVSATKDSVMMVESEANCLSQEVMLGAVAFGHEQMQPVIELIEQFKAEAGKEAWEVKAVDNSAIEAKLEEIAAAKIAEAYAVRDKQSRVIKIAEVKKEALDQFSEEEQGVVAGCFKNLEKKVVRANLLETGERIDGRKTTEVRNIVIETGFLPRTHGSALFTRGETQSITAATLGTSQDEQRMETLEGEYSERFLLHYNFPPFSVGEAGMVRGPGRREIGHGKLAQRALRALMPTKEEFPYTIRLVSEITESNGSSSMATVCAASLAMMDAGVPLREHVSGIAMGLIKEGDKYTVLSDILGDEDHLGDMDFKVAGTKDGITALQMDIKINGITQEIMTNALAQANEGRLHILGKMQEAIEGSRESLSEFAPVIKTLQINKDKIRDVIGSGGKVIKEICEVSGAKVDIDDTGKISVSAVGKESLETALEMIKNITMELKVGMVLEGKVARIVDFGAFVTLPNKQDGLLHISEIANKRLESVTEVLSESEIIKVKIAGIERGKIKLSMKNINQETGEETAPQPKEKAAKPEKSEKKPSNNNSDNSDNSDSSGDSGNAGGNNSPKGADDENLKNIMSSSKRKRKFFGGE